MTDYFIQRFDYMSHPHFNPFVGKVFSDADNILIYESINRIDTVVAMYIQDESSMPFSLVDKAIKKEVDIIRSLVHQRTDAVSMLRKALDICIQGGYDYVIRLIQFKTESGSVIKRASSPQYDVDKLTHLQKHGYCEYQLPQTDAFVNYCQQQMSEAREKFKGRDDWRGANWEGYDQTEGYRLLKNYILDQHILDMVSDYKGREMEFKYLAWDYNHHRQTWFKNVNGIAERSPTNYYHFDAEPHVAKMMIYLSDVTEADGPFRFVKGSHSLGRSSFIIGLHHTMDFAINRLVSSEVGLFARHAFMSGRELIMQFPHAFIGSTHFGDDLMMDSPLSRYLLDNTVVFTRKAGAGIVFDGYLGVHAGGNPTSGERLAVQIGFIQKKPKKVNSEPMKRSVIKRGMTYIKKKIVG
jgi:hypothetical protein